MSGKGSFHQLWLAVALVAAGVFVPAPLAAQRGALVQSRNLAELVSQSATIVRGSVLHVRVESHPDLANLSTIVVTLRVRETLKGDAGPTFTFRQFIWDVRDRYDAAGYSKGQDLLLLMNPVTRYGLTSPAGLDQGRFRVWRDALGREVVSNGRANAGLFRSLPEQLEKKQMKIAPHLATLIDRQQPGPIALQDMRDLVRQLNGPEMK